MHCRNYLTDKFEKTTVLLHGVYPADKSDGGLMIHD
jgi:hypothetical protein